MNTRSFFLSALIAGALIGVLGNLPLLNLVNCIFCLWVWLGGVFAVYLYQRFQRGGAGLSGAQGAGLGAVAGIVGALVGVVVFSLTRFASMPILENFLNNFLAQGDLPFGGDANQTLLVTSLILLTINIVLYPFFGAIGGLIAASAFRKKDQA